MLDSESLKMFDIRKWWIWNLLKLDVISAGDLLAFIAGAYHREIEEYDLFNIIEPAFGNDKISP